MDEDTAMGYVAIAVIFGLSCYGVTSCYMCAEKAVVSTKEAIVDTYNEAESAINSRLDSYARSDREKLTELLSELSVELNTYVNLSDDLQSAIGSAPSDASSMALQKSYDRITTLIDSADTSLDRITSKQERIKELSTSIFNTWSKEIDKFSSDALVSSSSQMLAQAKASHNLLDHYLSELENSSLAYTAAVTEYHTYLEHCIIAGIYSINDDTIQQALEQNATLTVNANALQAHLTTYIESIKPD